MADPIPTLRSLDNLVTDYSVFERDQVLTEAQLNSVAQYFDDQDRLTRVELIGVGIVGGLRAIIAGGKVVVGKGVGVSTDGDLLLLQADTIYDSIKPYDEAAPFYAPFYTNSGTKMLKLWELVKEGESDVRKTPIATLPGKLSDYAVLMYVESYQQDHDLCNAADCDNLGVMATHTTRFLLISLADAPQLLNILSSASTASLALSTVSAERPKLTAGLTTTSALAQLYRSANNNTHSQLINALPALNTYLPGLLIEQFGSNPIGEWIQILQNHAATFVLKPPNTRDAGIQYYYEFLKDVVETWNELLACLFENDSVLCPDVGAFPKHLLLGELSPAQGTVPALRTAMYPSPLGDRKIREKARHLVERLDAMIRSADFPLPSASTIRITPSRDERAPLAQRAIPFYYTQKPTSPIMLAWNPILTARKLQGNNQAYQWKSYMGPTAVQKDPYALQIGACDFFRIEGHFSQKVDNVMAVLKAEIEKQNLPITLRAILLHNDKKKIIIRPPRYTDLHRFHVLIRKEVSVQMDSTKQFGNQYRDAVKQAATAKTIPAQIAGKTAAKYADDQSKSIADKVDNAMPALGKARYSEYRKASPIGNATWQGNYDDVVTNAGKFRLDVGDMMRTDFANPIDAITNNHYGSWLDWMDTIIDTRNDSDDDKLLLANFFKLHPGIEHFGGVTRGGTFVLIYDDNSNVVADFMLPYIIQDTAEDEPDEPTLPFPGYHWPDIIGQGYKLPEFIDDKFKVELDGLTAKLRPEWEDKFNIQTGYQHFFTETLDTLGGIFSKYSVGNLTQPGISSLPQTGNDLFDSMIEIVNYGREQIERGVNYLAQHNLPEQERTKAEAVLEQLQINLGRNINQAAQYMVDAGIDTTIGAGSVAVGIITNGARSITSDVVATEVKTGLDATAKNATGGAKAAVNNIIELGGKAFGH